MRSSFIISFLVFIVAGVFGQSNTPNILLIIADDMGIDATNGYLQSEMLPTTPTLDSLMANGIKFNNAWSAPQCTPTRASIMSGKYGIKTGVMRPPGNLDLEHQSIFSRIRETTDGLYAGAVIGKWHISQPSDYNHPYQHGIDHYEGLFTSSVDDYYDWDKVEDGNLINVQEYVTSHITDNAIDWLDNQDQPWFLWLAHVAPHGPFHVPPEDLYTQSDTDDNTGKYLASIEAMDHEIGRLLNHLDEETRNNTIVIFVGDNGTPNGVLQEYPNGHGKSSLYEGGIRVPMIMSGKGVSRLGSEDDNLVHVADLYSTIFDLAGGEVNGGVYNSMSLRPLLSCDQDLSREFIYTDYEDGNIEGWAIRTKEYKLIQDEEGREEFYKVGEDLFEENDLIGNTTPTEDDILAALKEEALTIRNGWSCQDGIQNGDEAVVDDCNNDCQADDSLSFTNIGCCDEPDEPSVYHEYIQGDLRKIYANSFPNHSYCYNSVNQQPEQIYHDFGISLNPTLASEITQVVRNNGRPARYFGVAKNGVIFAPAPATPFIFENTNTGEYNWDWVFEPTNNQGQGQDLVGLDCASAHTGPQGYHYHGNMFAYVDHEKPGISSMSQIPSEVMHIGWASDGFPVLYRFGPDKEGNIKELQPSYSLKRGLRPGDGITAPCGAYNGKYTNDYEYLCGKGDLDECNGIQSTISVETAQGVQTFNYFYVITEGFPQISRCLTGEPSEDFENGNDPLEGIDKDGDGFIEDFDCDDNDAAIGGINTPGAICDDGDTSTINDVYQSDGCTCLGVAEGCINNGGDEDQDGFCADEDCDDLNAMVNPIATEIAYNGLDDDCDPLTLDDDLDQDGFVLAEDCDDTNAMVNPDVAEVVYNGLDDDCDPLTLDDDLDQDGFVLSEDCNDMNAMVNPDVAEVVYNGLDDDCDPLTLDDDLDQDGFVLSEDCDDMNAAINPNADEIPNNGIDEDCDGMDLTTSIEEIEIQKVRIYPNPTRDFINLEIDEDLRFSVTILNVNGREVLQTENETSFNISRLNAGIYLFEIRDLTTGHRIIKKVVVAK